MRELFIKFQPEIKGTELVQEVQYAYQLMAWMGANFKANETIQGLMAGVVNACLDLRPHIYQINRDIANINSAIPYYFQRWGDYGPINSIVVPTGFDKLFTLPYRMQPAMVGLVRAASQMRYDGNSQYADYHENLFRKAIR